MTTGELIRTRTFQGLPREEQQQMLRDVRSGALDLAVAPSPDASEFVNERGPHTDDQVAEDQKAQQQRGPLGILPNQIREPVHQGSIARTFFGPIGESMTDPTFAEQYLPESLPTRALSGLERGGRMVGGVIQGAKNVLEQGLEQTPRLVGLPPVSSPVSRVAPDVPELIAQAKMPVTGRGLSRDTPRRFIEGAREAVTGARGVAGNAAEGLRQAAESAGISLNRAESLAGTRRGTAVRMLEGAVEASPTGAPAIINKRNQQLQEARDAVAGVGPTISPEPVTIEAAALPAQEEAARRVREAAEAQAEHTAAKAAQTGSTAGTQAQEYVDTLGPAKDNVAFVAHAKEKLRNAEDAARAEAATHYKAADDLGGSRPIIALRNVASEASRLVESEGRLGTLRHQRVAGAAQTMRNTALDFVDEYGLHELKTIDYPLARLLDERLGGEIAAATKAGNDASARQLRALQRSLRQDINETTIAAPGDLGAAMKKANDFYRTRVGEPFGPDSTIRGLHDTDEARKFDKVLFDPTGAERTAAIKAEMVRNDPRAWDAVEARFGARLMRDGLDPTTGHFDPKRVTSKLNQYTPEALTAILGDKAQGVNDLRARFQRAAAGAKEIDNPIQAAAVFRAFAKANPEGIVLGLADRPLSEIQEIKAALRPEEWNALGRAWWEKVILKNSIGTTDVFSRSRFLTQMKDLTPEHLAVLVGPEAAQEVATLRTVIAAQEKVHKLGDNPPGTARTLVSNQTLGQVGLLAGALFLHPSLSGVTMAGASIVTPYVFSRLLVTARGSRALLDAARAVEGTQTATQAAKRLAILVSMMQRHEGQHGPQERTP